MRRALENETMNSESICAAGGFEPMTVHNTGFLVDRLGQDCHPLQFLRELTQNGIEAILRTGSPGEIIWDAEHYGIGTGGEPVWKLNITDNGAGMTGEQLEMFINQLSSSGSVQGVHGNYGVGAKISAATRNPHGVVYESWQNGEGSKILLYRDAHTGQYGLKQWDLGDDRYAYHAPLRDDAKPAAIADHGTKVTLLGRSADDSTMRPPDGTKSPSRWIAKYLNARYYKFPEGVDVRVREGWEYAEDGDRNVLRTVTGMESYLLDHAVASGSVKLIGATAHWWILKDEPALTSNSGHIESSGHVAALYQNELYELQTGITGINRLQQFGILFGHRQVVVYMEPSLDSRRVITTNTARTHLLRDGEPLPWADWARQFLQKMPRRLRRFVEEKGAAASNSNHRSSIRKRLQKLMHLFNISRYRPSTSGSEKIEPGVVANGGPAKGTGNAAQSDGVGKTGGDSTTLLQKAHSRAKDGRPGRTTKSDPFPAVAWISIEGGTREAGQLEDRAARYLAEQNLLQINADFCAFADMIDHCCSGFNQQPGARDVAESAVRSWYEQTLIETVLGIQSLRQRKEWSPSDVERAISPEALTASVMPKYHVHSAAMREITRQLIPVETPRRRSKPEIVEADSQEYLTASL
jgi:hypothetical protein